MRVAALYDIHGNFPALEAVLAEVEREGVDVIVDTPNSGVALAINEVVRTKNKVFINSGNLRNPSAKPGEWILDETVWVINDLAESLVRSDPQYASYRAVLDDTKRLRAHHAHRERHRLE